MNDQEYINYSESQIEIPLNKLKEITLFCLPPNTQIEDEAIKAISLALRHFLKVLANKIHIDGHEEKKILIKDIKSCIENEKLFSFLKKLIEK